MAQKMTDMKFTKADKKERMAGMEVGGNDYPWGLTITLDAQALKKMGIEELPDAGDECQMQAIGKVTRVSQSANANDENDRSVEIQITNLALLSQDTDDELWKQVKTKRKEAM